MNTILQVPRFGAVIHGSEQYQISLLAAVEPVDGYRSILRFIGCAAGGKLGCKDLIEQLRDSLAEHRVHVVP